MAVAMAEAMVLPYQDGCRDSSVARRRHRRRDKLLIAGWAVYVGRAASLQAGVQGCNGGVRWSSNPAAQVPGSRVGRLWGTPHTTWVALRASPAGPSTAQTARPWRGRASARPDTADRQDSLSDSPPKHAMSTWCISTQHNKSTINPGSGSGSG